MNTAGLRCLLVLLFLGAACVSAQDPCASYTSCTACSSRFSCGWCGATGRCHTGSTSGPTYAGSSCTRLNSWRFRQSQCVGTCTNLVTTAAIFGSASTNGLDLRSWTGSTLHWIGCMSNGCSPADFSCSAVASSETLTFGSATVDNVIRAAVDVNDVYGDAMPSSFSGCCTSSLGLCNTHDPNNNGIGVSNALAICKALGYKAGTTLRYGTSNTCPEVHALDSTGNRWSSDFVSSNGYGLQWRCTGFDWVQCEPGVYGADCQYECPGGRSTPCSNRGTCSWGRTGSGVCTCNAGASGPACQYTDAGTCNGHGTVSPTGTCTCHTGWTGATCNTCLANYYPAGSCTTYCLASSTCGGRGSCSASGTCSCNAQFAGTSCERCNTNYYNFPTCKYCVASSSCSGRGSCDSLGSCACNSGFSGASCDACAAGYFGSSCTACPGGASTPCGGNGVCSQGITGTGACTCNAGYAGSACQYSDAVTCSGRGVAQPSGSCVCNAGWAGSNCNVCAANYYPAGSCTTFCSAASTCSNHGSCQADGQCVCNAGFAGPNCNQCAPGYFNYPSCSGCTTASCNNRGTCSAAGSCVCNTGATGLNCEACLSGYFGASCSPCPGLVLFGAVCAGHGSCSDGVAGTGACTCQPSYSGPDCGTPAITGITPGNGPTAGGTQITVDGRVFGSAGSIILGTTPQTELSGSQLIVYTNTRILFNMPAAQPVDSAGTIPIAVKRGLDSATTEALPFTLDAPAITSLSPATGSTQGLTVTINGRNFGTAATVLFDGAEVTHAVASAHTRLTFAVPPGTGATHSVAVRVAGRTSPTVNFAYAGPTISSITPASPLATTGDLPITIAGSNFGLGSPNPSVSVAGTACTYDSHTQSSIVCTLPAGSGEGREVRVTVNDQTATSSYTYAAPTISTVRGCAADQGSGTAQCDPLGGERITITGSNFGPAIAGGTGPGADPLAAEVGGSSCTDLAMTTGHTTLTCVLPRGVGVNRPITVSRGSQQASANLISYAAPALRPQTLRQAGQTAQTVGGAAVVNVPSTNPVSFEVDFEGDFLGNNKDDLRVFFGPAAQPQRYEATTISITGPTVRARVPSGVGKELFLSVRLISSDLTSEQSPDFISFPVPTITPNTLRLEGGSAGPSTVTGTGTAADTLIFNGQHFGTSLTSILVHYGPSEDPRRYLCGVIAVSDTEVSCSTQRGEGGGLAFTVTVGDGATGQSSLPGTDTFTYPASPVITSITGCSADAELPEGTKDCPTTGRLGSGDPVIITISGTNFGTGPSVTVNYQECLGISIIIPDERISCRLPASAGRAVPVVVSASANMFSKGFNYLSYALPEVGQVTGCNATASSLHTADCPRTGGAQITIRGSNFGGFGAKVLLGTRRCSNVAHKGSQHAELTCNLPEGTQLSRPLIVVQDGGELSESPAFVSYAQCQPGSFAALETDIVCSPCAAGRFTSVSASRSCLSCDVGTFSTAGATACTKCSPGTYAPQSAASHCLSCPPGEAQSAEGSGFCSVCPAGSFSPAANSTACTKCPVGHHQPASGSDGCLPCAAGSFASVDGRVTCERCDSGFFAPGERSVSCSKCPAGSVPNTGSAPGATACVETNYGEYTATEGQAVPFPCGVGRYAGQRGMTACDPCEPGKFAGAVGAKECTNCTAGTYSLSGASKCDPCTKGFYAPSPGLSACVACDAGRFQSADGRSSCSPCPLGFAQNAPGQPACVACAPGSVADTPGHSSCRLCGFGTRSEVASGAATACVDCEVGSYASLMGLALCQSCDRGKYNNETGVTTCVSCPPGTYADASRASFCALCPSGRIAAAGGAHACDICPAGRFSSADRLSCVACPAGKYQQAAERSTCVDCPIGHANSGSAAAICPPCGPGLYTNITGSLSCLTCPAGRRSAGGENELLGAIRCDACRPGTYQALAGQPECVSCPLGFASNRTGASACQQCTAGKISAETGAVVCASCPAGSYIPSPGQSSCFACDPGTFASSHGVSVCESCPIGRSAMAVGSTGCALCQPGEFGAFPRQATCSLCPAGAFNNGTGLTACSPCAPGHYADERGATACPSCPAGTSALTPGNALCIDCAQGRFSPVEGATECISCPAGTATATLRSVSCQPCVEGKFNAAPGQAVCLDCPVGRFGPTSGLLDCLDCAAGNATAVAGSVFCTPCSIGRFAQGTGQENCRACDAGRYASGEGFTECLPCPVGTATPAVGSSSCQLCEAGSFNANPAQESCRPCPLGHYAANYGSTECTPCSPRTFAGSVRSSNCTACPAGTATASIGQRECARCEMGRFASKPGSATCLSCPKGKAQGAEGQTGCYECFVGMAAPAEGMSSCEICSAGRFASGTGRAQCDECPAGSWQDEAGRTGCRLCPAGTHSSRGSSVCSRCSGSMVAPVEGMAQCVMCDVANGATGNEEGTSCVCGQGFFLDDRDVMGAGRGGGGGGASGGQGNSSVPTLRCRPCPPGARCDDRDVKFSSIETLPGWWRSDNSSLGYYRCIVSSHCMGGFNSDCDANREGPLCSLCQPGYKASTSSSPCEKCPDQGRSIGTSAFIIFIILLVLLVMYWFVLKAGTELEEATQERDHRQIQWDDADLDEFVMHTTEADADRARGETLARKNSRAEARDRLRRRARANVTTKLKIMLTFFQITTALAFSVDIPWPSVYQTFIDTFSFVSLDFVPWASLACVSPFSFYTKYLTVVLTPVAVAILIVLFFLIPLYIRDRLDMNDSDMYRAARKRTRRKFWRLALFTVFLMYPHVSSTTLSFFVCRSVNSTSYLVADFSEHCGEGEWLKYLPVALAFTLIYPLGVPAFFFTTLFKYRSRFSEPDIQLQLGFLFEAYNGDQIYFECVDMLNKLTMTALISFFPISLQMPAAMVCTFIMIFYLLHFSPYLRKGDDRLHLFAQAEIFLLVLMGYILYESGESKLDDRTDLLLSIVLIALTIALLAIFLAMTLKNLVKMWQAWKRKRATAAEKRAALEDEDFNREDGVSFDGSLDGGALSSRPASGTFSATNPLFRDNSRGQLIAPAVESQAVAAVAVAVEGPEDGNGAGAGGALASQVEVELQSAKSKMSVIKYDLEAVDLETQQQQQQPAIG